MPKEDEWVAVAPEFSSGQTEAKVAPPVSAYQFFQREMTQVFKRELMAQNNGVAPDVGTLTRAVSERWRNLPPPGRIRFENLAREDRTRHARESHAREVARLQRQELLRKEREVGILADGERRSRKTVLPLTEPAASGGGAAPSRKPRPAPKKRYKEVGSDEESFQSESSNDSKDGDDDDASNDYGSDQESESDGSSDSEDSRPQTKKVKPSKKLPQKKRKRDDSSGSERPLTDAQIRAKQEKEKREHYVVDRQEKLRKERADQAKRRLEFLLKQSDIFSHFGSVTDEQTKFNSRARKDVSEADPTKEGTVSVHRRGSELKTENSGQDEDEEDLINPETTLTTYLTSQPSDLGHGTMRDYQLEGLNWMLRLQENGVNGILAGEC